jgi:hypothetical protein
MPTNKLQTEDALFRFYVEAKIININDTMGIKKASRIRLAFFILIQNKLSASFYRVFFPFHQ